MKNNPFNGYTVTELTGVINDTIFDKEQDRDISLNVYVKAMTVEKCAELVLMDWKAVQKRLPRIKERIFDTFPHQKKQ